MFRPADRAEPVDPASARAGVDAARGRVADGDEGGDALRRGQSCGAEANAAKYLGAEAAFQACQTAVATHGGMGYAKEYHVERYLREYDSEARARESATDPVLHRGEGARAAEVVLTGPTRQPARCAVSRSRFKHSSWTSNSLPARSTLPELFATERRPLRSPNSRACSMCRRRAARDGAHAREPRLPVGAQARRLLPTRRLRTVAAAIDATDPVVDIVHPHLVALRDASRETAVLGKIQGVAVTYLDVVESEQAIRYTRARRANCARCMRTRSARRSSRNWPATHSRRSARSCRSSASPMRRWRIYPRSSRKPRGFANSAGPRTSASAPELSAIAVALMLDGDWYGLSVVGPTERIRQHRDTHAALLCRREGHPAGRARARLKAGRALRRPAGRPPAILAGDRRERPRMHRPSAGRYAASRLHPHTARTRVVALRPPFRAVFARPVHHAGAA